jgi:hypothetical protein
MKALLTCAALLTLVIASAIGGGEDDVEATEEDVEEEEKRLQGRNSAWLTAAETHYLTTLSMLTTTRVVRFLKANIRDYVRLLKVRGLNARKNSETKYGYR